MLPASVWSFSSDKIGIKILWHWLFGDGSKISDVNGPYATYLKKNKLLREQVASQVLPLASNIEPGQSIDVNFSFHAEIENGEDMIGYQYLHGTNADVGDFHISGSIRNIDNEVLVYDFSYTWNDIIDPNLVYSSDAAKSKFASYIPFSTCNDYTISITWTDVSAVGIGHLKGKKGWLFS